MTLQISNSDRRRFWMMVFFTDLDKCWYWHGALRHPTKDYGVFRLGGRKGRQVKAHRFALASISRYNFNLEDKTVIAHSCDNPKCVNPRHLTAVTQLENIRDCIRKGRYIYHEENLKRT